MIRVLLCCLLLPGLAQAQSRLDADTRAILQEGLIETANGFIAPGYSAWADAAAGLTSSLQAFCAGIGPVEAAEDSFAESFLAWQRMAVIQVGPIKEGKGPMRVQLWPDPKGFSRRAVRAAVRAADPALLDPGALQGRSVALVNLTALEGLVYGPLSPQTYACDLAVAIAAYQAGLAHDLAQSWQPGAPFRVAFDTAAAGNGRYASVDALIRELLSGAVVYTDRLRKFKLQRPLGAEAGAARPERSEARPSGLGLASIAVGFATLRDLYELPYGFFDVTPDVGGSMEFFILGETAGSIAASLSFATQSLEEILLEDGEMAAELRRFAELTLLHETYLKTGLLASLGLTAGFTSADGD
ncbi:MAG: imelysin family protein [Pseudomonadota bacterium]